MLISYMTKVDMPPCSLVNMLKVVLQ